MIKKCPNHIYFRREGKELICDACGRGPGEAYEDKMERIAQPEVKRRGRPPMKGRK